MYRVPINTHNRLKDGQKPVEYCVIETHMGARVFGKKELSITISGALEYSGRVLSYGAIERSSQPQKDDILTAFTTKQAQHTTVELDNSDNYLSKMIAKEPFLGRTLTRYRGFEDEAVTEHIPTFSGKIIDIQVHPRFIIEADER